MDSIRIVGGKPLKGTIEISGAKNAALPLMAAGLLTEEPLVLERVPDLADIKTMSKLLEQHGASVTRDGNRMTIQADDIPNTMAPYDLVRQMRASILVLGPLVARFGNAAVSLPGGCAIGTRPVDLHLDALQQLGAEISLGRGYIHASAPNGLKGGHIVFEKASVGATENAMMAAALAEGETIIENAAREPEISDLAKCLVAMGANIEGIGSSKLHVTGASSLRGATHAVVGDRIEAGTYAIGAAITGGDVELTGIEADNVDSLLDALRKAGADVQESDSRLRIGCANGRVTGVDIMTDPFPGFPTDLQAQFMTLMTTAEGAAMITETIFENRFMHVPELMRMGADIVLHGASAMVRGVPRLTGAEVMATDLRASSSLVLAALAAEGESVINRVYHLDRGYEAMEEKLSACGAEIERIQE